MGPVKCPKCGSDQICITCVVKFGFDIAKMTILCKDCGCILAERDEYGLNDQSFSLNDFIAHHQGEF